MGNMNEKAFLNWVADRLVHVHGDNENVDFIHRLREIADEHENLKYENMILEEKLSSCEEKNLLTDKE